MQINYIQIDTTTLSKTISDMEGSINNLKNELESIYQDIQELDAMWDGPANEIFNMQFESDRQEFISMCDDISEYIEKLRYAGNEYVKCESKVGDIVRGIRL